MELCYTAQTLWNSVIHRNSVELYYTSQLCGTLLYSAILWNSVIHRNSVELCYTAPLCGTLLHIAILWNSVIQRHSGELCYTAQLWGTLLYSATLESCHAAQLWGTLLYSATLESCHAAQLWGTLLYSATLWNSCYTPEFCYTAEWGTSSSSSSSSSLPLAPKGAQVASKRSPGIPISAQPVKLSPGVTLPLCSSPQIAMPGTEEQY